MRVEQHEVYIFRTIFQVTGCFVLHINDKCMKILKILTKKYITHYLYSADFTYGMHVTKHHTLALSLMP